MDVLFDNEERKKVDYVIDGSDVEEIVDKLLFDSDDDELSKEGAMSIFKKNENDHTYKVTIKNFRQFLSVQRYVAVGLTFNQCTQTMQSTKQVTNIGYFSGVHMTTVIQNVRSVVAISFQWCTEIMKASWTYAIAFDGSNKGTSSYLDVRMRLFCHGDIHNFHVMAIPMF